MIALKNAKNLFENLLHSTGFIYQFRWSIYFIKCGRIIGSGFLENQKNLIVKMHYPAIQLKHLESCGINEQ